MVGWMRRFLDDDANRHRNDFRMRENLFPFCCLEREQQPVVESQVVSAGLCDKEAPLGST